MTRTFDWEQYEEAFEFAQELHDEGIATQIELHDKKITVTYKEAQHEG